MLLGSYKYFIFTLLLEFSNNQGGLNKKDIQLNIYNTASNYDGVVLKIYLNHKFEAPQEGLNCESLAYEVVT